MGRNTRRKTSNKSQEISPGLNEKTLEDNATSKRQKRKSDSTNTSESYGTPLSSPQRKIRNKSSEKSGSKQTDGKNNNATVTDSQEEGLKEKQTFLQELGQKFNRRNSEPVLSTDANKNGQDKRFSLIDDAIRNPALQLEEGIRYLSGEEEMDDEEELEEGIIHQRINRKIVSEKQSQRKSRSKQRKTPDEKRVRESPPLKVDLNSQPEFQILLKELREVKEQLRERQEKDYKEDLEQRKSGENVVNFSHKKREDNVDDNEMIETVLSPSVTTIYEPAVRCVDQMKQGNSVEGNQKEDPKLNEPSGRKEYFESELSKFLNNIRLGNKDTDNTGAHRQLNFEEEKEKPERPDMKQKAQERILQAEKFRAEVQAPKGKDSPIIIYVENEDDKFLHVTCHLEETIKCKIKRGEYVELDKLLPKSNMCGYGEEQNKMGIFHKDGETYFAPAADKKSKIWNIHTWDKAFRVYISVYTAEHPRRTTEIMQYVQNIHHAASKYRWENVAYYDYVFRRLMEQFPNRSWAKTYTQGWTYAMCEPIVNRPHHQENQGNKKEKRKLNICWKFNQGFCDYGDRCRFPHKCTHCGSYSHGGNTCYRKGKRKSESSAGHGPNNNSNGSGTSGSAKKKRKPSSSGRSDEPAEN